MIKIAICDDEKVELQKLYALVSAYLESAPLTHASISSFQSPDQMLLQAKKERFQLYILDIIMEGKNGIEAGEAIRRMDSDAIIIYQTVSPDYAVNSYAVRAFYYLLKPVGAKELYPVLEEVFDLIQKMADKPLVIKTRDGLEPVKMHGILFVEYHGHRLSYHLTQGRILHSITYREPFDSLSGPLLEDSRFIKISSSFIVNMTHILKITKKGVLMADGTELVVTRLYSRAKKDYLEFLIHNQGPFS